MSQWAIISLLSLIKSTSWIWIQFHGTSPRSRMSSFDLCRSLWSLARLRPEGLGSVTPSAKALVAALEAAKGALVGSGMGIVDICWYSYWRLLNILGMFSCIVISNSQQLFIFDDKLLLGEVYRMSRLRCLSKLKTPKLRKNSLIVAGNQRFGPHSFFTSYIVVRVSTTNNWWHDICLAFRMRKSGERYQRLRAVVSMCGRVPMMSHQFQYADKPMQVSHTPCTMNDSCQAKQVAFAPWECCSCFQIWVFKRFNPLGLHFGDTPGQHWATLLISSCFLAIVMWLIASSWHHITIMYSHYFFHVYSVYSLLKDHHFPSACEQQGKVFGLSLAQALWALPRCLAWQPGSRKHDESSGHPKKIWRFTRLVCLYFILLNFMYICTYHQNAIDETMWNTTKDYWAPVQRRGLPLTVVLRSRDGHMANEAGGFPIEIGSPTVRDQSCHT